MTIFIDDQNRMFYEELNSYLYNVEEIIYTIRKTVRFTVIWLYIISIPYIFMLIWITAFIIHSFLRGGLDLYNIFLTIIFVSLMGYIWFITITGIYIGYKWRVGISDQQIIDNLLQQGKIVDGEIIKITPNNLHFIYHNGGKFTGSRKTSTFITNHWEKFQVGDKVAVLYAHNVADCLL